MQYSYFEVSFAKDITPQAHYTIFSALHDVKWLITSEKPFILFSGLADIVEEYYPPTNKNKLVVALIRANVGSVERIKTNDINRNGEVTSTFGIPSGLLVAATRRDYPSS